MISVVRVIKNKIGVNVKIFVFDNKIIWGFWKDLSWFEILRI